MSDFDQALIERIRDDLADLNARCGWASPGLCALAAEEFDACLAEIDRLTQRDCQNKVLEDSGVKAVKCLDSACTYYCEWYATGRASDAGHVAYDLVSRIREALHILRLAETEGL